MSTRTSAKRPQKARSKRTKLPPVETYTDSRIAQFLLNNSMDAQDYALACADVRKLGLDPAKIDHVKPPGVK
ncbi:MAG TPA: hypothetical protein VHS31_15835 [Tepidisphaeraceae bacterium]|jgi:hypothetical protein|nr:hypothetical protein [Tepidisphaeraceae bacterium]